MAINAKPFVDQLVNEAKMDKADAETKVADLIRAVNTKFKDEDEATRQETVRLAVAKIVSKPKAEKFKGICVAVGRKQDQNDYDRRKALEAYEQNPVAAVNNGLIKIDNKKPIVLDTRKYVDAANTMENRNYGKPLAEVIQRNMFFLLETPGEKGDTVYKITRVIGNIDPDIGVEYELFGAMSKKGNLSVYADPAPRQVSVVDKSVLWDLMVNATADDPLVVGVSEANEVDKNKYAIFAGTVRRVSVGQQITTISIDDVDTIDPAFGFSDSDQAAASMDGVDAGAEVIAIGRKGIMKDKRNNNAEKDMYNFLGVIMNPESAKMMDHLKDIDDIINA